MSNSNSPMKRVTIRRNQAGCAGSIVLWIPANTMEKGGDERTTYLNDWADRKRWLIRLSNGYVLEPKQMLRLYRTGYLNNQNKLTPLAKELLEHELWRLRHPKGR
jgi:hypothetical protein